MLAVGSSALLLGKAPPPEDVTGASFLVGNWFTVMEYGRSGEDVTWVVLRAWPETATPQERATDTRFDPAAARIRRPDGRWVGVEGTRTLYFFSSEGLLVAPIAMRESDLTPIVEESFSSLAELEGYIARFAPPKP
ncbi:MAG: hypothetical protein OEO21_03175 [Candidatus Krumholzibacteria bacterium]|nr:hypothetical protein [Candidatus Krumholzibacteria bacterium]